MEDLMSKSRQIFVDKNEINEIKLEDNQLTFITVKGIDNIFEFAVRKTDSKKCLVFGSGAYDIEKIKPPIFQRITWIDEFDENIIYYNDPTLYNLKSKVGWGYGSSESWYLEESSLYFKALFELLEVNNENVLFYGSSAGGFMSLNLATFIKGSKALVNNPQTNILNYSRSLVEEIVNSSGDIDNVDNEIKDNMHRLSICENFKKNSFVPRIMYLQNCMCKLDINMHVKPFLTEISNLTEMESSNIKFEMYFDHVNGHNPLSKEDTIKYIKRELNSL